MIIFNKLKLLCFPLCVLAGLVFLLLPRYADAISVTVKRVIFEGPKRAEVITIINNSDREETYRLSWSHFKMTQSKSLVAVPEDNLPPEIRPVVDMVRFSPRRFTIPPRGSQQVRMALRTPANLADGEYRSHLSIRPEESVSDFKDRTSGEQQPGVSLRMLAGVSMPIIVRKGALDVNVDIENLSAVDQGREIFTSFTMNRQGSKSSYGDLDFICNDKNGTGGYVLKFTRGFSIYEETDKRNVKIRISKKPDQPKCSTLMVRYTETDGFVGKAVKILAESQVPVQ